MIPKFAFVQVFSFENDNPTSKGIIENYKPLLTENGGVEKNSTEDDLPVVYFIMTGGTEKKVLDLINARKVKQAVYILAHPGNNSLPASMEVLAYLQQEGNWGKLFYLNKQNDNAGMQKLLHTLKIGQVKKKMSQTRIGLFGKPSDWLIASMPNSDVVKSNWGPEIVDVKMEDLQQEMGNEYSGNYQNEITRYQSGAKEVDGLPAEDFKTSFVVFDALKKQIEKHKLDALSVRCFDLVVDNEATGCIALAHLNDQGIVAGCEGDINATLAMLLSHHLLNEVSWMANVAKVNPNGNKLWLAHCTIARSMVSTYNLLTHFESDLGIGIQGELPKGPCTLIRIGGKDLKQIWLAEGKITRSGQELNLCRTQVEIQLKDKKSLSDLMDRPLGNHLVLIKGHHKKILQAYWEEEVNL